MITDLKLSHQVFEGLSKIIHEKAGINLTDKKKELVKSRLSKIIREENFGSYESYYEHLIADESGAELSRLLDSITTNLTNFFREPVHFDFMTSSALPGLAESASRLNQRSMKIWSAGCSTGEEPNSIAITVVEYLKPNHGSWEIKILATDISQEALVTAKKGIYRSERVTGIPDNILRRYFQINSGQSVDFFKVKDHIRKLVYYRYLNFVDSFPFKGQFDIIFCRNVMIYFDKPFQKDLVKKLHAALKKGGYLFIGHAESINWPGNSFEYIKPTVYRK